MTLDPLVRSWQFAWLAEGRSQRTLREMTPFLVKFQDKCPALPSATCSDCEEFIAGYASPFRANYAWRSLRSFFNWWAEEDDVPSPMAKVKAPRVPLTDVKIATDDDVSRLLRSIAPFKTVTACRDAAIVSLLWATGLLRTELSALDVSDIDLDTLTLVVRKSKNGKARRVPFDARSAQHIARYLSKRRQQTDVLWLGRYRSKMA